MVMPVFVQDIINYGLNLKQSRLESAVKKSLSFSQDLKRSDGNVCLAYRAVVEGVYFMKKDRKGMYKKMSEVPEKARHNSFSFYINDIDGDNKKEKVEAFKLGTKKFSGIKKIHEKPSIKPLCEVKNWTIVKGDETYFRFVIHFSDGYAVIDSALIYFNVSK